MFENPNKDEGGYFAKILELGCFAEGETPNEALAEVKELGEEILQYARMDGVCIPLSIDNLHS